MHLGDCASHMYKYVSCCLAKAAYPREAKDLNLESLRGRRAAVSLARADAGEGGPGHSEGDAHGMRLLASE